MYNKKNKKGDQIFAAAAQAHSHTYVCVNVVAGVTGVVGFAVQ